MNLRPGALLLLATLSAAGCGGTPTRIDNICAIFEEYPDWYEEASNSEKKWGVPIPVMMSIIHQESSFRPNARPDRTWYLGFIPGPRPSSAYGYAQALDETWDHYVLKTGNRGADRDDFADTVDFLGWYCNQSSRRCGISRSDAYRLYLAYHEGQGGYNRGSWRGKTWLLKTARKVSRRASDYQRQLRGCRKKLEDELESGGFLFF